MYDPRGDVACARGKQWDLSRVTAEYVALSSGTRLDGHPRLPLAPRLGRLTSGVAHDVHRSPVPDDRSNKRQPPLRIYQCFLVDFPFALAQLRQQQLAHVCVAVTLRDLVFAFAEQLLQPVPATACAGQLQDEHSKFVGVRAE